MRSSSSSAGSNPNETVFFMKPLVSHPWRFRPSRGERVELKCSNPTCGVTFIKRASQVNPTTHRYCTRECREAHSKELRR